MSGRIVTFYSYKGGVGRTFALANVAAILAQWGARVLAVDWDIEAPGLTHYFAGLEGSRGVLDFLQDCMEEAVVGYAGYKSAYALPGGGSVDVMPALGKRSVDYTKVVQSLEWDKLYDTHELGARLEDLRQQWTGAYDLVLIDSRTGITDFSGITTAQLPDVLVFLFTANAQSLTGCIDVANRAMEARRRLSVDRAALLPLPVPARFDQREEYERARHWRSRFVESLTPFVDLWKPTHADTSKLLDHLTIPYQARWTFGEDLAAVEEPAGTSGTRFTSQIVTYALETLSAVLVHGLAKVDLLVSSRDEYVHAARSTVRSWRSLDRARPRVFISNSFADRSLAEQLASALRAAQLDLSLSILPIAGAAASGAGPTQELTVARLTNAIEDADAYVVLIADDSKAQELEIEAMLRQRLRSEKQKPVIPLVVSGREGAFARSRLSDFVAVRSNDGASAAVEVTRMLSRLEPFREGILAPHSASLEAPTIALPNPRGGYLRSDKYVGTTIDVADKVVFEDSASEKYGSFVGTRGYHEVLIENPFRVSPYLVTNELFGEFVRAGGYQQDRFWAGVSRRRRRSFLCGDRQHQGPSEWASTEVDPARANHPVSGISYYEAQAFIQWLNDSHPGPEWAWVLPSEDMWEVAARGKDGRKYPWGNEFRRDACNSAELGLGRTTPVGEFEQGKAPFGGFDFAGNVWEFVDAEDQADWECVLRGGSYRNNQEEVKSTLRLFSVPQEHRPPDFGFRCAQVPRKLPLPL